MLDEFMKQYGSLLLAVICGGGVLIAFITMFLSPDGVFSDFLGKFIAFL